MTVRCPACGTMNAPEDAFCGTCGTALPGTEVGSNTEPAPPQPVVPTLRPEPLAGPSQACGVCGAQNAISRTFCRVCGSTLALPGAGSRIQAGTPPDASALPAAAAGRVATVPAPSRGGGGWLVALAVLGLLAGILFVLLPSLLGSRPVTEAVPTRAAPTGSLPEARSPVNLLSAGDSSISAVRTDAP